MKPFLFDTFTTPLGKFSVALDRDGALVATAFGDEQVLRGRMEEHEAALRRDHVVTAIVRTQIEEFFAGRRRTFSIPVAPIGTSFQNRVWAALETIPFGETRSYGEVAAILGKAGAARAVGRANATNPRCLIAPCHRVIGADGSLTGFAFGETIKRRLLEFEREAGPSH